MSMSKRSVDGGDASSSLEYFFRLEVITIARHYFPISPNIYLDSFKLIEI